MQKRPKSLLLPPIVFKSPPLAFAVSASSNASSKRFNNCIRKGLKKIAASKSDSADKLQFSQENIFLFYFTFLFSSFFNIYWEHFYQYLSLRKSTNWKIHSFEENEVNKISKAFFGCKVIHCFTNLPDVISSSSICGVASLALYVDKESIC